MEQTRHVQYDLESKRGAGGIRLKSSNFRRAQNIPRDREGPLCM
jgi:hypothetical protein